MKLDPKLRGKLPTSGCRRRSSAPTAASGAGRSRIPGGRTLATPAVVDGRVFLGGGFGSYDFYAFDADDGTLAWQYQTNDDGPTAAVVDDGFVVFNTESCELEVLTVEGAPGLEEMARRPADEHAGRRPGRGSTWPTPTARATGGITSPASTCATGRGIWKQPIDGEVITAPVLAEGHVYLATLDGTLSRFRQDDGHVEWNEPRTPRPRRSSGRAHATSASARRSPDGDAAAGRVVPDRSTSPRATSARRAYRQLRGDARKADYLDHAKRMRRLAALRGQRRTCDAAVGFAHVQGRRQDAPGDEQPRPRPRPRPSGRTRAPSRSSPAARLYAAHGDTVSSPTPARDQVFWKKTVGRDDRARARSCSTAC